MSVMCARPDSEFFHSIPDLHDAVDNFNSNEVLSKLELFRNLFERHGVTKEFGLVMVHRHCDLTKDEVMVETLNDESSVSVTSPWKVNNENSLVEPENDNLWKEHGTTMKKYVVPQTWSFDKNGNLKSFEYLATDAPMQDPPQSFVSELFAELKDLGLDGILGIRRVDNSIKNPGWENTPEGTRSNVVFFGANPDGYTDQNSVPVLWLFDVAESVRDGDRKQPSVAGWCIHAPQPRVASFCFHGIV